MGQYLTKTIGLSILESQIVSGSLQLSASKAVATIKVSITSGSVVANLQSSVNDADYSDIPGTDAVLEVGDGLVQYVLGPLRLPRGLFLRAILKPAADTTGTFHTFNLLDNE